MIRKILIILIFFLGILKIDIALSQQCTISVTPISFGNYDAFSSVPLDTTGTVTVNCSDVVWAEVKLGVSSSSGTFNPRRMRRSGGNDFLDYNIYTNATRTVIFGDGTGGTGTIELHKPPGTPRHEPWSRSISMYSRIPPGQNVSVGTYSDTLTATVNP
jgi:spore coat protein U-like protein